MSKVFIIAEAACTWLHAGLEGAYRSIRAAKECGADAWKTQYTSMPKEMARRRGMGEDAAEKYKRLCWIKEWMPLLKAECDRVGIEFMCTVFIPKDIPLIAPYVSRFKVSAFESQDISFLDTFPHLETIVSINPGKDGYATNDGRFKNLHCISRYPTAVEEVRLSRMRLGDFDGLSDHTTSTLTGALCVAAGGRIVEKHVKLEDTPVSDPDFPHSLTSDKFKVYCELIREAERAM